MNSADKMLLLKAQLLYYKSLCRFLFGRSLQNNGDMAETSKHHMRETVTFI